MNRSEKRKELWKQREIDNLCIYCGKNSPLENKKGCGVCLENKSKKTSEFSKNNRSKINQYLLLLKHQVIEKYGGICNCCGESQILFLTIDHKNNDGYLDRNVKSSSTSFYLKLRRDEIRNDLQVLCWNCNLGKNMNSGICPHQEVVRKLDPIFDNRHISQFDTRLKIIWPEDDELIKICNDKSVAEVARDLGVDFSAVSGRLKRRNKYHLVVKKTGGIKYGEDNKSSKLSKDEVENIRKESISGVSRKELSDKYNVSISLIDKIVNYKIWKKSERL